MKWFLGSMWKIQVTWKGQQIEIRYSFAKEMVRVLNVNFY